MKKSFICQFLGRIRNCLCVNFHVSFHTPSQLYQSLKVPTGMSKQFLELEIKEVKLAQYIKRTATGIKGIDNSFQEISLPFRET